MPLVQRYSPETKRQPTLSKDKSSDDLEGKSCTMGALLLQKETSVRQESSPAYEKDAETTSTSTTSTMTQPQPQSGLKHHDREPLSQSQRLRVGRRSTLADAQAMWIPPRSCSLSRSTERAKALAMGASSNETKSLKLIINSHVKYGIPLCVAIESLVTVNFTRFRDVVVVIGGSDTIAAMPLETKRLVDDMMSIGIFVIPTPKGNGDVTALTTLYDYRQDARVKADSYLYTSDTIKFIDTFPAKFDKLASSVGPAEIRAYYAPDSFVTHFGNEVVGRYGRNFDTHLNKSEGLCLEQRYRVRGVTPLVSGRSSSFADKVTLLGSRTQGNIDSNGKLHYRRTYREMFRPSLSFGEDVYRTNLQRTSACYRFFGICKYILWGRSGDIDGHIQLNEIPNCVAIASSNLDSQVPSSTLH